MCLARLGMAEPGKARRGFTATLAEDARLPALTFIDIDPAQRRVYGDQEEGAAFGHAEVQGKSLLPKGLNPLISVIGSPLADHCRVSSFAIACGATRCYASHPSAGSPRPAHCQSALMRRAGDRGAGDGNRNRMTSFGRSVA